MKLKLTNRRRELADQIKCITILLDSGFDFYSTTRDEWIEQWKLVMLHPTIVPLRIELEKIDSILNRLNNRIIRKIQKEELHRMISNIRNQALTHIHQNNTDLG